MKLEINLESKLLYLRKTTNNIPFRKKVFIETQNKKKFLKHEKISKRIKNKLKILPRNKTYKIKISKYLKNLLNKTINKKKTLQNNISKKLQKIELHIEIRSLYNSFKESFLNHLNKKTSKESKNNFKIFLISFSKKNKISISNRLKSIKKWQNRINLLQKATNKWSKPFKYGKRIIRIKRKGLKLIIKHQTKNKNIIFLYNFYKNNTKTPYQFSKKITPISKKEKNKNHIKKEILIRKLEKWVKNPKNKNHKKYKIIYRYIGDYYFKKGNETKGINWYMRQVSVKNLKKMQTRKGFSNKKIDKIVQKALSRYKNSNNIKYSSFFTEYFYQKGQYNKAINIGIKAINQNYNSKTFLMLVASCIKAGNNKWKNTNYNITTFITNKKLFKKYPKELKLIYKRYQSYYLLKTFLRKMLSKDPIIRFKQIKRIKKFLTKNRNKNKYTLIREYINKHFLKRNKSKTNKRQKASHFYNYRKKDNI